jgi:ArsR family transcriptional regulator
MTLAPDALFRALADPTRLRCLLLLAAHDELCVCEFTHALGEIQPKISRHLAMLREAGIVLDRREGLWIHYRLHPELPAWARQVLNTTARASTAAEPYARDRRRLDSMSDRPPMRCSA